MRSKDQISEAAARAFNRANAAFRSENWDDVIAQCLDAVSRPPSFAAPWVLMARAHMKLGQVDLAEDCYQKSIELEPTNFSAQLELGHIKRRHAQLVEAIDAYRKAASLRPEDRRAHLALVRVFEDQRAPDKERAAAHYHLALEADHENLSGQLDTHLRVGTYRLEAKDPAGALEALRAAQLLFEKTEGETAVGEGLKLNQARALFRLQLSDQAEQILGHLTTSREVSVLKQAAELAYSFNAHGLSVQLLERVVSLQPGDGAAELALADMLCRAWRLTQSQNVLSRAREKDNVPSASLDALEATLSLRSGDVDAAITCFNRLRDAGEPSVRSRIAMSSLYLDHLSPSDLARLHHDLFMDLGEATPRPRAHRGVRGDRPLRIGMVTKDLHRQHPIAIFTLPMLSAWDNARFPLTIYFVGDTYDQHTHKARQLAHQWRDIALPELPASVAQDKIDILIDLAGHTNYQQMTLFAQRLAPVQATYLGYPATTGVPNMDWIIGDQVVTPKSHAHLYSEGIAQLSHGVFCYAPDAHYPLPDFKRSQKRPLTFGSFNNVPKLSAETIALWAKILSALPTSRLVLKAPSFGDEGVVAKYRALFEARDVAAERLEFRGPVALVDMMAEYADIDIGLDPLPYNGGTTTLQAMWMGVPVITMEGGHFVSRMGASFMRAAGLPEWVATSDQDYVAIAEQMAADPEALTILKAGLRDHLKSRPGWNIDVFVRDFERLLTSIAPPN